MFLNANALINSLGNPFRDIAYILPDLPLIPTASVCCGARVVKLICTECNFEYMELMDSMLNSQRICNVCMEKE